MNCLAGLVYQVEDGFVGERRGIGMGPYSLTNSLVGSGEAGTAARIFEQFNDGWHRHNDHFGPNGHVGGGLNCVVRLNYRDKHGG